MSTYKRRREDESTFGFGRYPKRSRRECNGFYSRDYHSLSSSLNKEHLSRHHVNGSKLSVNEPNLYHYSLSSELYGRNSCSTSTTGHRFSNCSNVSQQRKRRHYDQVPKGEFSTRNKVLKRNDDPNNTNRKVSGIICN